MVVNVSPRDADYDEAVNAMKYAALSREVKVRPRVPRAVTATAKYDASGHLIRKPSDCADAVRLWGIDFALIRGRST